MAVAASRATEVRVLAVVQTEVVRTARARSRTGMSTSGRSDESWSDGEPDGAAGAFFDGDADLLYAKACLQATRCFTAAYSTLLIRRYRPG